MYTNGTTNYNLPQYVDSDKATWTDLNAPFNQIDAAIKAAVDDTAQEALDIDALKSRMNTAEQNIGTNTTDIAGLDTRLTTAEGAITSQAAQITDVKQDTEDMICAYNEASATSTHTYAVGDYFIYNDVLYKATQAIAIGDTIVPDTNCSTTNVTTELLVTEDLSGDVGQLQTDVGQLQTDVGQLQTDFTGLSPVVVPINGFSNMASGLRACALRLFDLMNSVSINRLRRSYVDFNGSRQCFIATMSDSVISFSMISTASSGVWIGSIAIDSSGNITMDHIMNVTSTGNLETNFVSQILTSCELVY